MFLGGSVKVGMSHWTRCLDWTATTSYQYLDDGVLTGLPRLASLVGGSVLGLRHLSGAPPWTPRCLSVGSKIPSHCQPSQPLLRVKRSHAAICTQGHLQARERDARVPGGRRYFTVNAVESCPPIDITDQPASLRRIAVGCWTQASLQGSFDEAVPEYACWLPNNGAFSPWHATGSDSSRRSSGRRWGLSVSKTPSPLSTEAQDPAAKRREGFTWIGGMAALLI